MIRDKSARPLMSFYQPDFLNQQWLASICARAHTSPGKKDALPGCLT